MSRIVTSAFVWKLMERIGYQGALLVIQIVLARLLSPDDFGVIAIIIVFVNLSTCFVQSGLNTALIQAQDVTEDDYSTVFWSSFTIAVVLYVIIFFTAPTIASFYNREGLVQPLRVLSLVLIINAYNSVQVAHVIKTMRMRKVFVATCISVCISGSMSIILAFLGFGIWALVCQQLAYQLCSCAMLAWQVRWKPSLTFELERSRRLFSFGWKILASSLINMGYQDVFDLVVGKVYSPSGLGFFNQGKKIPQVVSKVFESSVQPVMLSVISRFQDNLIKAACALRKSMSSSSFLLVPFLVWLAVDAHELIVLIFSEKWASSVPYMQAFCMAYLTWPVLTCCTQGLNAIGRSDITLKLSIVRSIIGLLFLVGALIVSDNPLHIAFSFACASSVSALVNAIACCRLMHIKFSRLLTDLLPLYGAGFMAGIVAYTLHTALTLGGALSTVFDFAVIAGVYLGAAWTFKFDSARLVRDELRDLLDSKLQHSADGS